MRKAILLAGLFLMLGGCPQYPVTNNMIVPTPTPTATPEPIDWLSSDPYCDGTISRAEWLVCDNKMLNDLHRRLAQQWQTARQTANADQLQMLQDQLYALLSERNTCQDANCVAAAYRRYLTSAPPVVSSTPPRGPVKTWHGRRGHRGHHGGWGDRPDRDSGGRGEPSCLGQIGPTGAQRLAQQCAAVQGRPGVCSPRRSCESLQSLIVHGCRETYRKPGFCKP